MGPSGSHNQIFHFLGALRYNGCIDNPFSHSFYWIFVKHLTHFPQNNTLVLFETLNAFFSKQYLDAIDPFSYVSSQFYRATYVYDVHKCSLYNP